MFLLPGSLSSITKLPLIVLFPFSQNMHVKLPYQILELETSFNAFISVLPIISLKYIFFMFHMLKNKSPNQPNKTNVNWIWWCLKSILVLYLAWCQYIHYFISYKPSLGIFLLLDYNFYFQHKNFISYKKFLLFSPSLIFSFPSHHRCQMLIPVCDWGNFKR